MACPFTWVKVSEVGAVLIPVTVPPDPTTRLTGMNGKKWTSAYGAGLLNLKKALS